MDEEQSRAERITCVPSCMHRTSASSSGNMSSMWRNLTGICQRREACLPIHPLSCGKLTLLLFRSGQRRHCKWPLAATTSPKLKLPVGREQRESLSSSYQPRDWRSGETGRGDAARTSLGLRHTLNGRVCECEGARVRVQRVESGVHLLLLPFVHCGIVLQRLQDSALMMDVKMKRLLIGGGGG